MMSVSELCSFRTTSESGTLSGQRSFQRACWCMIFVAESPNVMRWSGYGWSAIGNENFRRPRFSRNVLSIRGCYRLGTNGNGDRQERIQLQASAKGFGDFSFGYKVREGDTLTSIAKKYNVPIQTIAAFNEIIDVDYLPAGKVLLIPNADVTTGKDIAEDHKLSNFVKLRTSGGGTTSQTESSVIPMPVSSSAFCVQSWHVKLALSVVLLVAISSILRRYISGFRTRRQDNFLQVQLEDVQETYSHPRLRRWQSILNDNPEGDEVNSESSTDMAILDAEEENLRQSYAQLESAYLKFLADSGLSKTGYWRGGTPPAVEEK